MKKVVTFLMMIAVVMLGTAAGEGPEKYIEKWAPTAVREMYRSGVPASITLAQGLLESGFGQSELATKGNNHFGIKCHSDWKGKSMKVDDDRKGECFRAYDDAADSFRDHSDFLRYQDRYRFLFDFQTTDYESWAYGLKRAGYATDPNYPAKLIKYIKDYDLARFDTMTQAETVKETKAKSRDNDKAEKVEKTAKAEKPKKVKKHEEEVIPDVIPPSPTVIEEAIRVLPKASEEFRFSLNRQVYTKNGVPFVYSQEGETFDGIARANNLFYKEILKFNDLSRDQRLLPGTVVYLQMKKKQAEKGLDKYIVAEDGESLRDICQRFAVRMKSVCKLNSFNQNHPLREGETIILRKQ